MTKTQARRVDRAIDKLFDLARAGVCSCWPECAYKVARKVLEKLMRDCSDSGKVK